MQVHHVLLNTVVNKLRLNRDPVRYRPNTNQLLQLGDHVVHDLLTTIHPFTIVCLLVQIGPCRRYHTALIKLIFLLLLVVLECLQSGLTLSQHCGGQQAEHRLLRVKVSNRMLLLLDHSELVLKREHCIVVGSILLASVELLGSRTVIPLHDLFPSTFVVILLIVDFQ